MPRLPIHHTTLTYAGRELTSPGAAIHLEDTTLELPWNYGTETVGLVGSPRAIVTDSGNASGELTLPIVQDYPDITSALAALIELKAWADAHPTGSLSLALTHPPEPLPPEVVLTTSPGSLQFGCYWVHLAGMPAVAEPIVRVELDTIEGGADELQSDYLSIWEQREDGEWEHLAISDAKGAHVRDGERHAAAFTFSPGFRLSGRPIRLHANPVRTGEWVELWITLLVSPATDDSSIRTSVGGEPYKPGLRLYRAATPPALTYSAGLQALNTRLTLAPRGYRLTAEWQWHLT